VEGGRDEIVPFIYLTDFDAIPVGFARPLDSSSCSARPDGQSGPEAVSREFRESDEDIND
jgi:hypothetical protein